MLPTSALTFFNRHPVYILYILYIYYIYIYIYIFYIVLEGYVKSNFASIYNNKLNKNIGCGSLTDGIYKLEIHIINFKEDDLFIEDIKKGDKIEVVGKISNTGK